jgi:hypothetical protein
LCRADWVAQRLDCSFSGSLGQSTDQCQYSSDDSIDGPVSAYQGTCPDTASTALNRHLTETRDATCAIDANLGSASISNTEIVREKNMNQGVTFVSHLVLGAVRDVFHKPQNASLDLLSSQRITRSTEASNKNASSHASAAALGTGSFDRSM